MSKLSDFLFKRSPKELALYFILAPMVLFLLYTIISIGISSFSDTNVLANGLPFAIAALLIALLVPIIIGILFWFRSVVFSVEKSQLGMPRLWFTVVFIVFIVYLIYQLCGPLIEKIPEGYRGVFYALNELTAFAGILIAYPIICHYTARAIVVKQKNKPSTFLSAMPFTLVLIFGNVLAIPFFHKYFSEKKSSTTQIAVVYAIAFGLFILILIIGFIAAITGLV